MGVVLLMAVALNLDALGVGMAYGLRGIRLGVWPRVLIAVISAAAVYLAATCGGVIGRFVSPGSLSIMGGLILIGVGLRCWLGGDSGPGNQVLPGDNLPRQVLSLRIPWLGLVINILREPATADLDSSGAISGAESWLVGAALALDSLAAGLGMGMLGVSPWELALAVISGCWCFVTLGIYLGEAWGDVKQGVMAPLLRLPGIILILIGIWKIWW